MREMTPFFYYSSVLCVLPSFSPHGYIFCSTRLQAVEQQQQQQSSGRWLPKMELSQLPGWIRNWILFLFCYPSGPDPVSPPRGVGVSGDGVRRGVYSGVRSLPGRCHRSTSVGPHQATPVPPTKPGGVSGQQLQLARGLSLRTGRGLLHATPAYLSSQDATPGQASTQLDNNTAD